MMTTEMGKTIVAARAEVLKCAKGCRFYASTRRRCSPTNRPTRARSGAYARVRALRAARAGARGDAVELPAVAGHPVRGARARWPATSGCSSTRRTSRRPRCCIEDTFRRAGFPDGAFQTLLIGASSVERILRDPRVRAATLTGSTPAGSFDRADRGRGAQAGRARARRQRPVRRHAVGRHREGRAGRGDGPRAEQRPELHRGQAVHRARRRRRRVRGSCSSRACRR